MRWLSMRWLLAPALATIAAPLAAHASEEVPFVTTPDHVTRAMLELARVKAGDHVVDLGSGDGRIVITAARMGATGLGVEIVPELVAKSRENARRAGIAERIEFRQQDLFDTSLDGATVVTMYLLPELNLKLRPRLLALPAGTRVVSHDWDMGQWQPIAPSRSTCPTRPWAARSSRVCTCGWCRHACTARGARRAGGWTSSSGSSAGRRC
jgi:SAM-dependent methyltransferase